MNKQLLKLPFCLIALSANSSCVRLSSIYWVPGIVECWKPVEKIDTAIICAAKDLDVEVLKKAYGSGPSLADSLASKPVITVTLLSYVVTTGDVLSYVEDLISLGADCNERIDFNDVFNEGWCDFTPVHAAVNSNGRVKEMIRLLVDNGADINYKNRFGLTIALKSLTLGKDIKLAHWLITEMHAEVPQTFTARADYNEGDELKEIETASLLLNLFFPLDSEEYRLKMEIVAELEKQGIDYWRYKDHEIISKYVNHTVFDNVKARLKPDNWEEYLKKY